jgi:hypothetical protein
MGEDFEKTTKGDADYHNYEEKIKDCIGVKKV